MEKSKILDEFYNSRVEKIARITEEDLKVIESSRKELNISKFFPKATEEEKEKIKDFVELNKERVASENVYFNSKYYKMRCFGCNKFIY